MTSWDKRINAIELAVNNTATQPSLKQTTCAYCGVGCGVDIELQHGVPTSLKGTPEHPANYGRLCVKGTHLLDTIGTDGRLLEPEINGQQVSWQSATQHVAEQFTQIIKEHGKDAVAFYVSGQLLTEDYYVANKLMKGYIGSANIDTNSRLCMSSAVSAYKRAFGEDIVPCNYDDIEHTDLMIIVGSNAAWTHPVLFQRLERAKQKNPHLKVVVIDPRKTPTADSSDLYLAIKPGSDAALYNGLLNFIAANDETDESFITKHTENFDQAMEAASPWTIEKVAEFCQLSVDEVTAFYHLFCQSEKAISFYSMGINQSTSGVDKCNAIINVHLASGKIIKTGCGPFSITGQPNAMGGREVGGLANQLTAHMDIENTDHQSLVQRFWDSPTIATQLGAKAIDLFDQIAEGKIKAVWIMATNPVVSLPNRNKVEQALKDCPFVVVSDCVASNDTLEFATVKLPATGWLEKNGTVTNSERRISRQRGILAAPGQAKHDWQIMSDVAIKMGFSGFDYQHPVDIFTEYAQLTGFENKGERLLDISGLSQLSENDYDQLLPVQWPINSQYPKGTDRVFGDKQFSTASKKAQFIAITPALPVTKVCEQFPLVLNSGRIRDQWHTMTRTGKSATLSQHISEPFVALHSKTAQQVNVKHDQLVCIKSKKGQVTVKVVVDDAMSPQQGFMPIHWNKQFASYADVNRLYAAHVDPISGQAETKQTAVSLKAVTFATHMRVYLSKDLVIESEARIKQADFWVKSLMSSCIAYQVAWQKSINQPLSWCQSLTIEHKATAKDATTNAIAGEWIALSDSENSKSHILFIVDGVVKLVAYVSDKPNAMQYEWVNELIDQTLPEFSQVQSLLNGVSANAQASDKTICSCHQVKASSIKNEIKANPHCTVASLGDTLKCGTNCGSCKPELRKMIDIVRAEQTPTPIQSNKNEQLITVEEI